MENIKIGYSTYKVIETECVNKFIPRKGEIDFVSRTIRLDSSMKMEDKKETIIHEILHGVEEFMALEFEENQIKALGAGLALVFQENKHVLKFLLSETVEG